MDKIKELLYGFLLLPGCIVGYVSYFTAQGYHTGSRMAMRHITTAYDKWDARQ